MQDFSDPDDLGCLPLLCHVEILMRMFPASTECAGPYGLLFVQVETAAALEREFIVRRVVDFTSRTVAELPKFQLVFCIATDRVMEADVWCGSAIVRI